MGRRSGGELTGGSSSGGRVLCEQVWEAMDVVHTTCSIKCSRSEVYCNVLTSGSFVLT